MKITYTENPLLTVIELDDAEKKELWYKIKIGQLEDMASEAHHLLSEREWYNTNIRRRTLEETVDEACQILDPKRWYTSEWSKMDERVDELHAHYLLELQQEHFGDCTCVPCSCSKCHAEDLVGSNTIAGLGKHQAHHIARAFNIVDADKNVIGQRILLEALDYLADHKFIARTDAESVKRWEQLGGEERHIKRWNAELLEAYAWLRRYANEHFAEQVAGTRYVI